MAAFGRLAGLVNVGRYTAADVLDRLCGEVRSSFGYDGAAVLRHDTHAGTVLPVVRQRLDWPDDALAVSALPFVAAALARREAVWPGEAPWLDAPVAVPLLVADRCPAFVVADRPADAPDGEALHLLSALGSMGAVLLERADHDGDLENELAELQHIDRLKTDFLGIASHELRTPIAVVHGIASTLYLRGAELTAEQVLELRGTLYEQTTRLVALAQALLDLSRVETGALQAQPRRFNPRDRIEALLRQIAPDRLDAVHVDVPHEWEIVTDPEALDRIVGNLVGNALRHGIPPVEVRALSVNPFRLVVEDHGAGVDPAFVARLFDRFSRGGARARPDGAGLGLAIARSYAYALGGDLTYGRESRGARFELLLPAVS
ncbi:MAG TPA: HAMP domain-containing sensor histidine kinase [Gaiellaceae bacterium]|nr:HAMP domain-containing sensor histidine kinase [Gaiellaceae bacterium]